jgi:hypothetical protein
MKYPSNARTVVQMALGFIAAGHYYVENVPLNMRMSDGKN